MNGLAVCRFNRDCGTGKTTTIRRFVDRLDKGKSKAAKICRSGPAVFF
jgi:hypothetical protein